MILNNNYLKRIPNYSYLERIPNNKKIIFEQMKQVFETQKVKLKYYLKWFWIRVHLLHKWKKGSNFETEKEIETETETN